MPTPQLKLITRQDERYHAAGNSAPSADPVRRVFDHWCFMAHKIAARTKLGPTRRQAIAAALLLYTEDDLQLAIEGNLVDEWCMANGRHDIDWLLLGESRIERFIDLGERLRQAQDALPAEGAARADPEQVRAALERHRARLDAVRGRSAVHG